MRQGREVLRTLASHLQLELGEENLTKAAPQQKGGPKWDLGSGFSLRVGLVFIEIV